MRKFPRSLLPPIQHFNKIICIYMPATLAKITQQIKREMNQQPHFNGKLHYRHTHIEVFPMLITHLLNVSSTIEFKRTVDMQQQKKKNASE